jgi:deoxycytidine triphosphate deaminase/cell division septum initiation protein DivIVA
MTDNPKGPTNSDFARTDEEAKLRFEKYKSLDPFPDIPPALLNSADVGDYARVTGMLWPFNLDKRKSASYEIPLLGKCVYWDDRGKKQVEQIVEPDDKFVLKANSIAFVTLEPMFRLPNYMALRFNLKISHIYKGILLGTGPLVDPGFQGKLSIPLHNLTTNDYTFKARDGLIWMEFTKISPNDQWHKDQIETDRYCDYKGFPPEKNELKDVEHYIEKAVGREGRIQSSIPDAIQSAQHSAENAASSASQAASHVESIRTRLRNAGIFTVVIALLAIFVPLYLGFYQIHSLITASHNYVTDARKEIDTLNRRLEEKPIKQQQFDSELNRLSSQLEEIRNRTTDQKLKAELDKLASELREIKNSQNR